MAERRYIRASDLGALALDGARAHFDAVRAALERQAALVEGAARANEMRRRFDPVAGGWSGALPPDVCPLVAGSRACSCAGTAALPVRGGAGDRLRLRAALVRAAELRVGARLAVGGAVLGGSRSAVHPVLWPVGVVPAPGGMGEESGVVWVEAFIAPRYGGAAADVWRLSARGAERWVRPGRATGGRCRSASWFGEDDGPAGTGALACAVCGGRLESGALAWGPERRGVFGASGRLR